MSYSDTLKEILLSDNYGELHKNNLNKDLGLKEEEMPINSNLFKTNKETIIIAEEVYEIMNELEKEDQEYNILLTGEHIYKNKETFYSKILYTEKLSSPDNDLELLNKIRANLKDGYNRFTIYQVRRNPLKNIYEDLKFNDLKSLIRINDIEKQENKVNYLSKLNDSKIRFISYNPYKKEFTKSDNIYIYRKDQRFDLLNDFNRNSKRR